MRVFDTAADLVPFVGEDLGASDWLFVDQGMIDSFAQLTGDHQWIHVDVARAARDRPDGRTIAHGFLVASLIPRLAVYRVDRYAYGLNYGLNRVRFIGPVPAGSHIRLRVRLGGCEAIEGGYRVTNNCLVEVEGRERGALVADTIAIFYDPE
jgi:acyl dehydratase